MTDRGGTMMECDDVFIVLLNDFYIALCDMPVKGAL